ncbi:acetyl-CoA carboxylase biotin carboxylase subunit family protein [Streptomyces sp. WP-1]|uniref:ATP-grasp domain-containing protein n=1 Tax=Streptomyces sp. WP-1 TaxID=3041497 RepID=UPI002649BDC2|nr:ATP-grasp domain-containing protein [Streptomyces sp. WP-1]WKE69698.1 ATP-grasp domain-containing protein [Streptomyces sp. WP-1]
MAHSALPTLLVVHDRGSATAWRILSAARGLCRVIFLCEPRNPSYDSELAQLGRHAEIADTTGLGEAEVCRLAESLAPAGVLTFSEHRLRLTAAIAEHCGLRFHSRATAAALTDKYRQRQVLSEAGVQHTGCVLVRDPEEAAAALDRVGTPAVLKPRHGAGSVDTCLITSPGELRFHLAEFTTDGERDFVLEEFLPGDPTRTGPGWADFVSVESLVVDGEPRTAAVNGKPPLVPPFRETGHVLPAPVTAEVAAEVERLAEAAVRALGIRHGITHTEIKFTPRGPRIIEVNGRLGGFIAEIVQRRTGYDMVAAALRLALGLPITGPDPARLHGDRVTFQYLLIPPPGPLRPGPPALLDDLGNLPGVDLVDVSPAADWRTDWRRGTIGAIGTVYGSAADHTELRTLFSQLGERLDQFWRDTDLPRTGAPRPIDTVDHSIDVSTL